MRRLTKLARLSGSDLLLLVEAQLMLIGARLELLLRPTGTLLAPRPGETDLILDEARAVLARRLELSVSRAAEHGVVRASCLVRGLALKRMLARRRIDGARIRIGVRMAGVRLEAHAWVEVGGLVLGDPVENTRRYAALTELDLVGGV